MQRPNWQHTYCDRLWKNNMWLISMCECVWSLNNILSDFTEVPSSYNNNMSVYLYVLCKDEISLQSVTK